MKKDMTEEGLDTDSGAPIIPSSLSAKRWKKKKNKPKVVISVEQKLEKATATQPKHGEGKHKEVVAVHKKDGKVFNRIQTVGVDKKPTEKKAHWFDKYKQYNLNKYPVGIPEADVKLDFTGDTDTHWVMSWKDPKSGKLQTAYTRKFLENNALVKWERIETIKSKDIDLVKGKSIALLKDDKLTKSAKDALAVIAIISHTGLRPGDEKGFKYSGNRGVSTLHADNINIIKDRIFFNFTGKSYKENNAFIKSKALAEYLSERIKENSEKPFLFETNKKQIDFVFKQKLGMKGFKVKDMRTFVATDMARKILLEDETAPPPLPDKKSEIKKIVNEKLKNVFEKVSTALNNTPAMAKSSYVHPAIIDAWLVKMGIDASLLKSITEDGEHPLSGELTLDKIIEWNKARNNTTKAKEISDSDDENCIEFPWPEWME